MDIINNISNTVQNIFKSSKNENEDNSQNNLIEFLNSVEKEREKIIEFKKTNIITINQMIILDKEIIHYIVLVKIFSDNLIKIKLLCQIIEAVLNLQIVINIQL